MMQMGATHRPRLSGEMMTRRKERGVKLATGGLAGLRGPVECSDLFVARQLRSTATRRNAGYHDTTDDCGVDHAA
jgi:hypothetical protein